MWDQGAPIDDAEAIATDMQYFSDRDTLTGDILLHEFRPDLIHQLLGWCLHCVLSPLCGQGRWSWPR